MSALSAWIRRLRWPPFGLGLGTPANLASLSPERREGLGRTLLLALLLGAGTALLVLGLDQLLFAGVSLGRVEEVGDLPLYQRLLICLWAAITEETIYRLGVSTLVAALAFLALRRVVRPAATVSIWIGIAAACVLFGLAHVGNVPEAAHPYLRAITLNSVLALVLGWFYWYRGLEAAMTAHFAGAFVIYVVVGGLL